jgi:hypothetical protein
MFSNFIKDIKIGFLEQKAQRYLSGAVESLQSDSMVVIKNHLNSGDIQATNTHLTEVAPSLDTLVELKEKYVKLREKFKHNKDKLLELAIDWKDFNELLHRLLSQKEGADVIYFKTRSEEIISRFNKMLDN